MKINNDKGFTLIQMLIGIALLGVMSMASLSLFTGMMKQAKSSESTAEFSKMHDDISTIVRNSDLCTAALKGITVGQSASEVRFNLPGSNRSIEAGKGYGANWNLQSVSLSGVVPVAGAAPNMRQGLLTLNAFKQSDATATKRDEFYIYFTLDASNQIDSCLSSTDPEIVKANCASLGGTSTGTNCTLPPVSAVNNCNALGGTYDNTKTPKCQLKNPCAANEIFMGTIAGVPQCKSPDRVVASSCTPDQVLISSGGNVICVDKTTVALVPVVTTTSTTLPGPSSTTTTTIIANPGFKCEGSIVWHYIEHPFPPLQPMTVAGCAQFKIDTDPGGPLNCNRVFATAAAAIGKHCWEYVDAPSAPGGCEQRKYECDYP
jgi:type II secretory pathway pseudopilin PulG